MIGNKASPYIIEDNKEEAKEPIENHLNEQPMDHPLTTPHSALPKKIDQTHVDIMVVAQGN
jgi:hypothetical protein